MGMTRVGVLPREEPRSLPFRVSRYGVDQFGIEGLPTVSPGESADLTGFADGFTVISRFVGARSLLQHPDVVEVPNLLAAVNAQRR